MASRRRVSLVLLFLVAIANTTSTLGQDCYDNNLDLVGENLNNGWDLPKFSAWECQYYCSGVPGANWFTWASQLAPADK